MQTSPPSAAQITTGDDLAALLPSWRRALAARRISPRTIAYYAISVQQLADFLAAAGMPTGPTPVEGPTSDFAD